MLSMFHGKSYAKRTMAGGEAASVGESSREVM